MVMKVAFTTLSCPEWSWETISGEASRLGYDGIEVRGIAGEMVLHQCTPFLPERIDHTVNDLKQKGLEICCLDTSCRFDQPENVEASLEEGRKAVDLAQRLKTPYIRVFGDKIPDPGKVDETVSQVAWGLEQLGHYAETRGVYVLIETHGDFSDSRLLLSVLEKTSSDAIGVLWDINHPYKYAAEPFSVTYERLGRYIRHVHIKDSRGFGKEARLCMIGEGDVPLNDAIGILRTHGYGGWLSLEWEKKWHPELEEPELALPAFIRYIRTALESGKRQ